MPGFPTSTIANQFITATMLTIGCITFEDCFDALEPLLPKLTTRLESTAHRLWLLK